jgi:glyoxalase family protein
MTPILGLHHVTAITADAPKNVAFYTHTLGLRRVKTTVNYDDPSAYHLYFGNTTGTPGTLLTFFVYPASPGTPGTGQASEVAFAIPPRSLPFWQDRLGTAAQLTSRFNEPALLLHDPDGLPLALIESPTTTEPGEGWTAPGIPAEFAIRHLHSVTLSATHEGLPASILLDHFAYRQTAREQNRTRFQAAGTAAQFVDVLAPNPRQLPSIGAGSIHHIAFRVPDDAAQLERLNQLREDGLHASPVIDRDYFHSVYFREPGGTLFELATDTPGMLINEPLATLGTRLILPARLEPDRHAIESALPPLETVPVA